jgi:hypothetical protein
LTGSGTPLKSPLYLSVTDFPLKTLFTDNNMPSKKYQWFVDKEMESRLSKKRQGSKPGEGMKRAMVQPGSLIYRLRSIKVASVESIPLPDNEWVLRDTAWPDHAFVELNGARVELRRKAAWGKDLPADLSNFVQAGKNELSIVSLESFKAANFPTYVMAVEVYECKDEGWILSNVKRVDELAAKTSILNRLSGKCDAEGVEVVRSDQVCLGVRCPLSFRLINTPVRGITCRHLECFDLKNFLETRPRRTSWEPPNADSWKCPICRGDARPSELIVDGFLESVLGKLKESGGSGEEARNISVKADGTWSIKQEKKAEEQKENPKEPEVICLDDD